METIEACAEIYLRLGVQEVLMIDLTTNALNSLKDYFEGKDLSPVRIYGRYG